MIERSKDPSGANMHIGRVIGNNVMETRFRMEFGSRSRWEKC